LIKVENRLSNNLKKKKFSDKIIERVLEMAKEHISEDTVVAVDGGDISKEYAKNMENIAPVRDGSTGEIKNGYSLLHVTAADVKGEIMVPMYMILYSSEAKDFVSENKEIIKAIDLIKSYISNKGIWTMDRGGDRKIIIKKLCDDNLRFVIRIKKHRNFLINKENNKDEYQKAACSLIIKQLKYMKYDFSIKKAVRTSKSKKLRIGYCRVKIPGIDNVDMYLVVIKKLSEEAMILLTNLKVGYEDDCYKPEQVLEI